MRIKSLFHACSVLILMSTLFSCGFSLRVSDEVTLPFDRIHLDVSQPGAPLNRQVIAALESAGITVITSDSTGKSDSAYVLSISEERSTSRPATVNSRARAAQYDLFMTADVQLSRLGRESDGVIFGPETLAVERRYFEDLASIAGSNEEAALLRREMRQELVSQLSRRLQAIDWTQF